MCVWSVCGPRVLVRVVFCVPGKWLSDQDGAGGNFPQDTFHAKRKLSLKLVYLTNFLSATGAPNTLLICMCVCSCAMVHATTCH